MNTFYIKTDLDVAGPFTGIEIREAALAGIVRPQTFLANSPDGPWLAAGYAGLFSEKATPLPHPPGTDIPSFQTRGMPGAFMGPFKLRELIGFACQGMLPPDAELQSDPTRPWFPITGTGILPACLRGDLVRIDNAGKLCLRTLIPADLEQRRMDLQTLQSPIERALQIRAEGATAAPLEVRRTASATEAPPIVAPSSAKSTWSNGAPEPPLTAQEAVAITPPESRRRTHWRNALTEFVVARVSPQVAVSVLVLTLFVIGLPVAYSAWKRLPLDRQAVDGEWIAVTNSAHESERPRLGVSFTPEGRLVLMNAHGKCWTGSFDWQDRMDEQSGFRPDEEVKATFAHVAPHHWEGLVQPSDGYLQLRGLMQPAPQFDGQTVRDLFVRREQDQLLIGYPTSARWIDGRKELRAGWVRLTKSDANANRIFDVLRDLPQEPRDAVLNNPDSRPLCIAIDRAITGSNFEYKGKTTFRNGCFAHSQLVDAAALLDLFGVADEARDLYEFEMPLAYNAPPFDGAQRIQYESVVFVTDETGNLLYVAIDPDRFVASPASLD